MGYIFWRRPKPELPSASELASAFTKANKEAGDPSKALTIVAKQYRRKPQEIVDAIRAGLKSTMPTPALYSNNELPNSIVNPLISKDKPTMFNRKIIIGSITVSIGVYLVVSSYRPSYLPLPLSIGILILILGSIPLAKGIKEYLSD